MMIATPIAICRGLGRAIAAARGASLRQEGSFGRRHRHTRLTTARPKTPLGLTISTATISIRAIVSFNSRPT